jgi:hypothetical protein
VKGPAKAKAKLKLPLMHKVVISEIRAMLKDAKIDGELMASLGNSIKILNQLLKVLLQTVCCY